MHVAAPPGGEVVAVGLAKRIDPGVAMFVADAAAVFLERPSSPLLCFLTALLALTALRALSAFAIEPLPFSRTCQSDVNPT